jgi:hypothetical protein
MDEIAVQSNSLIRANQEGLTLTDKRLLLFLISKIDRNDEAFKYYRISVSEFAKLLPNTGDNETVTCANAIDRLQEKKIKIKIGDHETSTRLVLKSKNYVGTGFFDVVLDDELKPYLLDLKSKFTQIYIREALQLVSVNAVRLYEILCSWEKTGSLITAPDKLREMLGVAGKYKMFSQFKANCLHPIFEQINSRTDIEIIDMEERKESRAVVWLKINFKKKSKAVEMPPEPKPMPPSAYSADLITDLSALGTQHLDKYEAEGIQEPHWRAAIASESEPAKIITTARTLAKLVAATKHKAESKHKVENSIEANRGWWNANYRALLLEPFWHGDRPLFMKNPPSSVEVESFCWVGLEAVNFGRSDFQEYILSKVKQFEDKLNERTRK